MCDHCDNISRRGLLGISAAGLAAALTGCQTSPVSHDLPVDYNDHLTADTPGPPIRIDLRSIRIPPPVPPQQSEYGEIIPRRAWTSMPLKLARGRPMGGVSRITIHHSGDGRIFTDDSFSGVAKHLQLVQRAHLARGMIDIAYHFAVDHAGRVWQLRWLGYEGQHVRRGKNGIRWNAHNVGIVALGDFNLQIPSLRQRERLFALVRLVREKYRVPLAKVRMHCELVETDCPGKHMIPFILDARRRHLF